MRILIVIFLLIFSNVSLASQRNFHAYAAVGITLTPSSYRVGYGDWEFGMINQSLGFGKIFDFGSRYYTTFGFLIDGNVGFYSSIGLKADLWIIPFRLELSSSARTNGDGSASGLVGVTYGF